MKLLLPTIFTLLAYIRHHRESYEQLRDNKTGIVYQDTGKGFLIAAAAMCDSIQLLFVDSTYKVQIQSFTYSMLRAGDSEVSVPINIQGSWICGAEHFPRFSSEIEDNLEVKRLNATNCGFRKGHRVFFDDIKSTNSHDRYVRNLGTCAIRITD